MENSIIRFEDIYFSYNHDTNNKRHILKGVSFNINKAEYVCVVGHNGCGKSTISKIMSCLLKPEKGNFYIDNILVNKQNQNQLRKKIGVIFQNPDNQFIGLTTEDDIAFGLENYCIKNEHMQEIIDNSAKIINITNLLKRESYELSGGQKQKVAITSVISLFPEVIIFDESTSMLDPKAKMELKSLMKHLQTNYNRTIVSITHDMEELINATRVLCIDDGKVKKFCNLNEFVEDYHFLKESKLDLPFTLKLSKCLHEFDNKIKITLHEDELIEELCQK